MKKIIFIALLVFFAAGFSSARAQELPKSWMPKWKVGDWWRVKYVDPVNHPEPEVHKFEVTKKTTFKGNQVFEIKVTVLNKACFPEKGHETSCETFFFVDEKYLAVKKDGCGFYRSKNLSTFEGAYPFQTICPWNLGTLGDSRMDITIPIHFSLPASPLTVGRKKIRDPSDTYFVQEVHRVTGKELIAKGYKPGGLFKPNRNYYEVTIMNYETYIKPDRVKKSGHVQIWSSDAPYWVYASGSRKMRLIDHSWKSK